MKRKSTSEVVHGAHGSVKWVEMRSEGGKPQLFVNKSVKKEIFHQVAKEPCNLISIFGAARQGKSFLMNCLAGQPDVFQISNFRESCTQGIDISRHMLDLKTFSEIDGGKGVARRMKVGFVDAEGQGDRDVSYDANLVCPILLTSKCVIFNWKDSMQKDKILNHMGIMHKAAMNVAVEGDLEEDGRVFGHLHLVFRDWQYANSDETSVYNDIFKEERSVEAAAAVRNQIRRSIKEAFASITVWLFPVPVPDSSALSTKLTLSATSDAFREKLGALRAKLSTQLGEPTVFNGKTLTGHGMAGLVGVVADVLNTGNTISPQPAWISMMKDEVEALRERYSQDLRDAVSTATATLRQQAAVLVSLFPPDSEALQHMHAISSTLQAAFTVDVDSLVSDLDATTSRNVASQATEAWCLLVRDLEEKYMADHANLQREWSDSMIAFLAESMDERFTSLRKKFPLPLDVADEYMAKILMVVLDASVVTNEPAYEYIIDAARKNFQGRCDEERRVNEHAIVTLTAKRREMLTAALTHIQKKVDDIAKSFDAAPSKGVAFKQLATSLDELYRGHCEQLKTSFEKNSSVPYEDILQELETGCFRMREQLEAAYSDAYKSAVARIIATTESALNDRATLVLDDGYVASEQLETVCDSLLDRALEEVVAATSNWSVSPNMRKEYLEDPLRLRANKVFDSLHFTNNKMAQQAERLKQQQLEKQQQAERLQQEARVAKERQALEAKAEKERQKQEAKAEKERQQQEKRDREAIAAAQKLAEESRRIAEAKAATKPSAGRKKQPPVVTSESEPESSDEESEDGRTMMMEDMEIDEESGEEEDEQGEVNQTMTMGKTREASSVAEQRARAKKWAEERKKKGKQTVGAVAAPAPKGKSVPVKDARRMSIADAKNKAKQDIDARAQRRGEALTGTAAPSSDSDKESGRQKKRTRK